MILLKCLRRIMVISLRIMINLLNINHYFIFSMPEDFHYPSHQILLLNYALNGSSSDSSNDSSSESSSDSSSDSSSSSSSSSEYKDDISIMIYNAICNFGLNIDAEEISSDLADRFLQHWCNVGINDTITNRISKMINSKNIWNITINYLEQNCKLLMVIRVRLLMVIRIRLLMVIRIKTKSHRLQQRIQGKILIITMCFVNYALNGEN
jgi:hypothetical protein